MPVLRVSREEATQLADALESFYLDPRIPEDPFAGRPGSDADVAEGQRLYGTLGCRACHILRIFGWLLRPATDGLRQATSSAVGPTRGSRTADLAGDVRCPNYGLTDPEALRLTAYLSTLPTSPPASTVAGGAK